MANAGNSYHRYGLCVVQSPGKESPSSFFKVGYVQPQMSDNACDIIDVIIYEQKLSQIAKTVCGKPKYTP